MKIVHVVPSADRMHPGHLNIIKTAAKPGEIMDWPAAKTGF